MPESKRPPPAAVAKSAKPPPVSKRRIVNLADDADEVLAQCRKLRDDLRRKTKQTNDGDDDDPSEDEWGPDDEHDGKGKGKGGGKKKKTSGAAAVKTDVDAEEGDSKKAKTQQLSLSELKSMSAGGRKSIVEVVEMNSTEVMEGIENVAVTIAHQVLARQGFQLDIPCELVIFLTIRSCESIIVVPLPPHDDVQADPPSSSRTARAASNQIYVPELDRIVLGDKRGTRSFLNVKVKISIVSIIYDARCVTSRHNRHVTQPNVALSIISNLAGI